MDGPSPARLRPEDVGIGQGFQYIRDAVVVGDTATGQIVLWNLVAEALLGYTADEIIGQPPSCLL